MACRTGYSPPVKERELHVLFFGMLLHEGQGLPAWFDLKMIIEEAARHRWMAPPADKCHISPERDPYAGNSLVRNAGMTDEADRSVIDLTNGTYQVPS